MKAEYDDHLKGEEANFDNAGIEHEWDGESRIIDAVVLGPEGSPYEGGYFRVKVILAE